ncbi:hypothetical protein ACH5RR_031201 [Cinchona calisaya]|uniref:Uncharacterized protein n=1 Tax=Cinchona calisaya TaxID=153742 RepID=A0ABD2YHJ7_9GENT
MATQQSSTDSPFTGFGNLIRLLPTGTVFLYHFLNPILSDNGNCSTANKYISSVLLAICGLSCFFSTFTDSYKDDRGNIQYGIATFKGFWPNSSDASNNSSVDLKSYRIQVGDFVHAILSLTVFCAVSLLDTYTVRCFYPSFESSQKALLMALPPVIGSFASTVFAAFPCKRHGIGEIFLLLLLGSIGGGRGVEEFGFRFEIESLDANTVKCFYPSFDSTQKKALLMALPPVMGAIASAVFVTFPCQRHSIGYPSSSDSNSSSSSSSVQPLEA